MYITPDNLPCSCGENLLVVVDANASDIHDRFATKLGNGFFHSIGKCYWEADPEVCFEPGSMTFLRFPQPQIFG
jgi:hypothetical protein